jgi:GDSL-like Lipase/Acylhydrolase family
MKRLRYWGPRLGMVVFGIVLSLFVLEATLRLFPDLRPDARARSVDLGTVKFTAGIGDLFIHRAGKIAPPPDPYAVLSEHRLQWDADGFRVPALTAERYPILALGDSYTEAANAALPWPDVLAQAGGQPVRNLGFRGYGPAEEARILKDYGLKYQPRLIVLGYYEGNDLFDVAISAWEQNFVLPAVLRKDTAAFDPTQKIWESDHPGPFQYPVQIMLNGTAHPMAFFDTYLSRLNAEPAVYADSNNLKLLRAALQAMQASAGDTCFYVAYIPDKAHILLPYVVSADRSRVLTDLQEQVLDKPGAYITERPNTLTYAALLARLTNQRSVIHAVLTDLGIPFIDLTPAFETAAARGEVMYYTYDTHWNQAGHDLAGRTIAAHLAQHAQTCYAP